MLTKPLIATHTNHYLDLHLHLHLDLASHSPQKIGASSRTRYQRINTLLGQTTAPRIRWSNSPP